MADDLNKLTPGEREVLEAIYRSFTEGKDTSSGAIADLLNKSEATVKTHKTNIYKKLEIEGDDQEKQSKLIEKTKQLKESPQPVMNKNRSWIWAVAGFLLASILFVVIYLSFPPSSTPVIQTVIHTVVQTIEKTVVVTSPPQVITSAPQVITTTPLPTNDSSSVPTASQSATILVTPTTSGTSTEVILFEDDFDSDTLDTSWVQISGTFFAYQGYLTTEDEEAGYFVGDKDWVNYRVSFDILEIGCYGSNNPFVGMRALDSGNFLAFTYSNCQTSWNKVAGFNHTLVSGTYQEGQWNFNHLVVSVNNFEYKASDFPAYLSSDYPNGRILIKLKRGMKIDNFKVIQLP